MLEEPTYLRLADEAFKKIQDAIDALDPDDAEAYLAGDVLTITFRDRSKCIVNTQRPTRQVWLAARSRAWHFNWDASTRTWIDDKGRGDELFSTLERIVRESVNLDVAIAR